MNSFRQCFRLNWTDVAIHHGLRLRTCGVGPTILLIPGMEGDGTSCVDLAEWLIERGFKIILVDYKNEQTSNLDSLTEAVASLLTNQISGPIILWSQSFGNVLATRLLLQKKVTATKHLLFSPFVRLPSWKLNLGLPLLENSPDLLFRFLGPAVSKILFGPIEAHHCFLEGLKVGDPKSYTKRIGWLKDKSLEEQFQFSSCKRAVWIGKIDKLIDPTTQIAFFQKHQVEVVVIERAGHMLLPEIIGANGCEQLLGWLKN